MKKILILSILLFGLSATSWACIDPNPDSVIVNMSVDTVNCELLVEVTNLRIMGGDPNQFCSCAVNDVIYGFGDITYFVFVDSITNQPLIGFDQFELNNLSSGEWDLADPSFNWNGFVSDINASGLLSGQSVSLWIKVDLYETVTINGFTFNPCDEPYNISEFVFEGALGTDEWDPVNNVLADDHQSIAYFYNNEFYFELVEDGFMDYYDDIVEGFYSGIEKNDPVVINVYPNPVSERLWIDHNFLDIEEVRIINSMGQVVFSAKVQTAEIDMKNYPPGIYHVRFDGLKQDYMTRIVKL